MDFFFFLLKFSTTETYVVSPSFHVVGKPVRCEMIENLNDKEIYGSMYMYTDLLYSICARVCVCVSAVFLNFGDSRLFLSRVCVFFFFTVSASIYMRNGHRNFQKAMNSMTHEREKGKLTKSATKKQKWCKRSEKVCRRILRQS